MEKASFQDIQSVDFYNTAWQTLILSRLLALIHQLRILFVLRDSESQALLSCKCLGLHPGISITNVRYISFYSASFPPILTSFFAYLWFSIILLDRSGISSLLIVALYKLFRLAFLQNMPQLYNLGTLVAFPSVQPLIRNMMRNA